MKKNIKRYFSLVLAIIMMVGVLNIGAFAAGSRSIPQFNYYTALGDSNGSGYGLDAYFANAGSTESVRDCDRISGSYVDIFANAIGAKNVNVRCHSGWRTNEFLYALLGNSSPVSYDRFFYKALDFVDLSVLDGEGDRIREGIKNADIISLDFGSNDIYSYALSESSAYFNTITEMLPNPATLLQNPTEYFSKLLHSLEIAGVLGDYVKSFKATLDKNEETYKTNIVTVIDEVRKVNPDAKIMVLGVFCPISFDLRINHKVIFDLKTSSDERVARINNYLNDLCKDKNCTFVERAKTECFGLPALDIQKLIAFDENVKYSAVKMVHPNEAGHKYIANQMIDSLFIENTFVNPSAKFVKFIGNLFCRNTVKWDNVDGAYRYRIYRSTSEDGEYHYAGFSLDNCFSDFLILRGQTYYYKVKAVLNLAGTVTTELGAVASVVSK